MIRITVEAVRRALLNVKWVLTDTRVASEVRKRGSLPEGHLSEDEIERIAVAMTSDASGQ
jgi:hypothetical protein